MFKKTSSNSQYALSFPFCFLSQYWKFLEQIFLLVGFLKLPDFTTVEINLWWSDWPASNHRDISPCPNVLENLNRALWFVKNGLCMLDLLLTLIYIKHQPSTNCFLVLFFLQFYITHLHKVTKNYINLQFKVTFSILS